MLFFINALCKVAQWMGKSLNGSQMIAVTFSSLILVGTLLLMLPIASQNGHSLTFIDALFTATSASCVTGLVVADTGKDFSWFGKSIIIILIQIGGLGIMTMTTLISVAIGKKINLRERLFIQESLNQTDPSGVVRLSINVVKYALAIEFFFGTILAYHFYKMMGTEGIVWGYWHSISAFCNAGFDLFGNYQSLVNHNTDIILNVTIMLLITFGGIGFMVIEDIKRNCCWQKLSLHSKLVLLMSSILVVGGAVLFWILEHSNPGTIGNMSTGNQIMASLFQSITARTAGFNSVDLTQLQDSSMFLLMVLMFIGASPTSTGGGLKTTTFIVLIMTTWALLNGRRDVVLFGRRIEQTVANKAYIIFALCISLVLLTFFALLILDKGQHSFQYILFELVSAFGTVGLGLGVSGEATILEKLILIITMFLGRIGVLTFVLSFLQRRNDKIRYPSENIIIG